LSNKHCQANIAKAFQSKIGWLIVLSSIASIVWLFHCQFELLTFSIFVMFLLLASLISICFRVGIGKRDTPPREKLAVYAPFSVYLGWITIASIAKCRRNNVMMKRNGFGLSAQTGLK
jgi:translocator protein